ncbi:protoporphyrinogen oxidase [Paenibacillus tarimensis]|uniref:protoporphyrinogen oxidase n=1 Tax=Paenibacillus tarimensis TaxID=416012 RepID=UPI001F186A72|nr:protoporphyrinogen oxidase [Paenibacillus tarimensis]MCF2943207.1 protoporphyrinogen oxidase [Paenibacillus tarimensis]
MRGTEHVDQVVIIGGGISGLSSAFYLSRKAKEQGRAVRITIVEPADSLGGKINTVRKEGFVIEKGPDSFLARKQPMIDLAADLGLEDELVPINPAAKKTYILNRGKLHPMPPGLVLGIPTEIMPFVKTGLLSPKAKLRAALDFVMPARKGNDDESIGGFLERRLGGEVVERIAEPLLAGIYAGELHKLSLRATFPQFREAERKHGSLIRGMRRSRRSTAASAGTPEKYRNITFLTFRNGLTTVVEALEQHLAHASLRLGRKVAHIHKQSSPSLEAEQPLPRYEVELDNGERLDADAVIVAAPSFSAVPLLKPYLDTKELESIRYVSVANVVLAFDKEKFGLTFDGSGFLVPRSEGKIITACTWTSTKWLHTSPDDKVLLRCYVGRSGEEAAVDLPDEQLTAAVLRDIRSILGIEAEPIFTEITRLRHSMPQYPVGHVEQYRAFRERLAAKLPGVWATGAAFEGVGLPDCIRQARDTAALVLKELDKN